MKKTMVLASMSLLWVGSVHAADSDFAKGKQLFQQQCLVCHSAQLDPPQAPPMFGVQMKYKMATDNKQAFVERVTSFATHPSKDKALLTKPVKMLGLMPDMGLDEADVKLIAAYIHDETFAPPYKHLQVAMRTSQQRGDKQAYRHHKQRYDAMCSDAPAAAVTAAPAESGTLKAIMQQLGRDYAAVDQAILMQDFNAAATAANHIANHEKPSLFQKMKIMAGLRTEMSAFKQADGKVHALAVDIEQAAKAKDMPLLIQRQSGMLSACMACHTGYRSKVKNIFN
ncbi:MAG: cytochrome c [Mariprofundus sp.]|nr:cytochrome c [Mariprofundus sp.]